MHKFAGTTQGVKKPHQVSVEIRNTLLNTWPVFQLSRIHKISHKDACVSSHPQLTLTFQAWQLPMDSLSLLCPFTETAPTPAEVPAITSHILVEVLVIWHYWHTKYSQLQMENWALKHSYFPKAVDFPWSTREITRITENTFCFTFWVILWSVAMNEVRKNK